MFFEHLLRLFEFTAYLEIVVMCCEGGEISCIPAVPGQAKGVGWSGKCEDF